MEYLISGIWVGMELLCSIFFSGAFLIRREISKKQTLLLVVVWIIMGVYTNLGIEQIIKQVCTIISSAGASAILYRGNGFLYFILALICYIFIAAIDAIIVKCMCGMLHISYEVFAWRKLSYFIITTADKLISVFFAWLLYRVRKKGNLGKLRSKWVQLSVLFPAVSAAMLAVLFYTAPQEDDVSISVAVFSGVLMVANIAMLYVIGSIEKAMEQEQAFRMLRQQISIQAENYSALKENYGTQRKATHEFERHIRVVRDLLDQGEYETTLNYVRQLQNDRALRIFCIASNNPVIDVVLNQKHQVAQENGIKMSVKVNDLSSVSMQANELVVLLSNLLDNAIEACQKLESQKEIACSILKEDSIYVSVRNTSLPVEILHGEILTTKPDPMEHGYGLQAVKYILEQFGAEYTFVYNDGWFQFVAEIPERQ